MIDMLLTVNAGSSSLKFAAYELGTEPRQLVSGKITGIGTKPAISIDGEADRAAAGVSDLDSALGLVNGWLSAHAQGRRVGAVVHRVVHGGEGFTSPVIVDEAVVRRLEALTPFAPLHQTGNLDGIRKFAASHPHALQVACFDTAFHATLPPIARTFPLPADLRGKGLRRYGFHGLSYEAILHRLRLERPDLANRRLIVAHLGSGSSLCAIREARSIATTMGLTALDGVPMGTRSGGLDPGLVLYLARDLGIDATQRLLYNDCGVKGLSGISADFKTLRRSPETAAAFALEVYCERVAEAAAALTVSLGGLDALVFTGGIGANDPQTASEVVRRLAHLQPFEVLAMETDEEGVMARAGAALMRNAGTPGPSV
jgi:acetate kinase